MAVVAVQRKRKSILLRFGGRGVTEEAERKATGGRSRRPPPRRAARDGGQVGVQEAVDRRGIPGSHTAPVRRPLRQGRPSGRWRSSPEGAGVQRRGWRLTIRFCVCVDGCCCSL